MKLVGCLSLAFFRRSKTSWIRPPQLFFIKLVFTTLSPLIFPLISKEKELNVDTPQGARLEQETY
jgi:hypothetical protein